MVPTTILNPLICASHDPDCVVEVMFLFVLIVCTCVSIVTCKFKIHTNIDIHILKYFKIQKF